MFLGQFAQLHGGRSIDDATDDRAFGQPTQRLPQPLFGLLRSLFLRLHLRPGCSRRVTVGHGKFLFELRDSIDSSGPLSTLACLVAVPTVSSLALVSWV